jgi:hypothetical protein
MSAGFWRTTRKWLAGLVAGLLFVSQIATAAQACVLGMALPVQAMQEEGCGSMPMDDSACRLRCLTKDETAASPDQPLYALALPVPAEHATIALPAAQCPSRPPSAARMPGGPPLRILHCSYQI